MPKKDTTTQEHADQIKTLHDRCTTAKLETQILLEQINQAQDSTQPKKTLTRIEVKIPEERDFASITIPAGRPAHHAINSHFEDYRRLKDYQGIWSSKHRKIECEITGGQSSLFSGVQRRLELLLESANQNNQAGENARLEFKIPGTTTTASLELASTEYVILNTTFSDSDQSPNEDLNFRYRLITLHINNIEISQHDQAAAILERISNSLLLSIDLHIDTPMHLRRRATTARRSRRTPLTPNIKSISISRQYDNDATNLYWYGRTSRQLPLLSFLAFYQVLEFYFPRYSKIEASKRVKSILKDPTFNPDNETDIARLLARIRSSQNSKSFGDEQSQLTATLGECINTEDLRDFIKSSDSRTAYYTGKEKQWRRIVDAQIHPESDDLVAEVSRRVYRVRCRIVHTKHEGHETELLLPFSREARALTHDIDLVEYLASRALITSSTGLSLNVPLQNTNAPDGHP
ncbi:hypothetical protein [Corallococcus exiguus]|uniref:hypothetical protein n=1 Tax=Corallococcus exiguus TaxID=83462 RepID=UPI003DA3B996